MRAENYEPKQHPPRHEYELNFGPNHPGIEGNYALKVKLHGDTVVSGICITPPITGRLSVHLSETYHLFRDEC